MVFPRAELDVDALIAEIRARGCAGVGCWSLTADARLGTRLVPRGFGWGWRPHWIALELRAAEHHSDPAPSAFAAAPAPPPAPRPTRFAVIPATPPYATTLPYAPHGPEPAGAIRLGVRLREKIIGQVVVNPHRGVAGIYAMGVAPRVRRRRIGAALIRAACDLAIEQGCSHAVLNATDEGEPVCRRAGFRSLGWGQSWWYARAPAPTPRETALTEAIGFGDLSALDGARRRPAGRPVRITRRLSGRRARERVGSLPPGQHNGTSTRHEPVFLDANRLTE
jgi:GNAT superfamily N-acetyltransferase